jgi:hypothetical protein
LACLPHVNLDYFAILKSRTQEILLEIIKNFIIRSQDELIASFDLEIGICDTIDLTPIDFNDFTLLGCYTTGNCKANIKRKVKIDNNSQTAIYTITQKDCGKCKALLETYNWVLVDVIPEDYTVDFIVE